MLSIDRGAESHDPRWPVIEAEIGLQLPGSYKALVERFGASSWRDFLHVLSPFDERLECGRLAAQALEADRTIAAGVPVALPAAPLSGAGGICCRGRCPTTATRCTSSPPGRRTIGRQ